MVLVFEMGVLIAYLYIIGTNPEKKEELMIWEKREYLLKIS